MSGIDFVVTWVDPSDASWRKNKEYWAKKLGKTEDKTAKTADLRDERYRDLGFFKYFFRSLEVNAPWVDRIFLVTDDQIPDFLNTQHPKLHIISHRDIIPAEYLPTFNSNVIESFLYRIPGLSETFVYFNDDILLNAPVCPEDFFRDGLPVDMFAFQPVVANPLNPVMTHILQNDALVISKYFDKRRYVLRNLGKVFKLGYPVKNFVYNGLEMAFPKFTGFYNIHCHMNLLRSTFKRVYKLEPDLIRENATHRFRSKDDNSIYMIKDFQKMTGRFYPCNLERDFAYFEVSDHNRKIRRELKKHRHKYICINDSSISYNAKKASKEIIKAFEAAYPRKSRFEK